MLFLSHIGQGNLRPFTSIAFVLAIICLTSVSQLHAQVDINIEVWGRTVSGGDPIIISPNPVVSLASVEHDNGLDLQSLTILDSRGETLVVLDLSQSSSFSVQLPAGVTSWIFQTSEGVITEQVIISG